MKRYRLGRDYDMNELYTGIAKQIDDAVRERLRKAEDRRIRKFKLLFMGIGIVIGLIILWALPGLIGPIGY